MSERCGRDVEAACVGGGVIMNMSVCKPEREDAWKMSSETEGNIYIL